MYECIDFEALKEEVRRERLEGKKTNDVDADARREPKREEGGLLKWLMRGFKGRLMNGLKSQQKNELKNQMKSESKRELTKAPPQNCSAKEPRSSPKEGIENMSPKMAIKAINPTHLYNYFQLLLDEGNDKCLFLVDLQTEEEFQMYQIKNAVHIRNEYLMDRMKKEIELKKDAKVVFYHANEEVQKNSRYGRLVYSHFANVKANFYLLRGGYENFEKEYFFLCINKNRLNTNLSSIQNCEAYISYPIKFCSNLFIGTPIHMINPSLSNHLNIKYVYDFTDSGYEMKIVEGIEYSRYNVTDRTVRNSNACKGQCVKYENILDIRMMYDIIQSILQNVDLNENICTVESNILSGNADKQKDIVKGTHHMEKSSATADRRHSQKKAMLNISNKQNMQNGNILIMCNHGMKNRRREKINSISLVIAMCYLMYTRRYDPNLIIASVLRINNNFNITAQTMNFLYKFYDSLKRYDYNMDVFYSHEKKRKMEKKKSNH
ncbi:mitogen-activated protein kinase phosphatase 1, putative [Plasmodium knowlesi strain H]|uniref:Mitogen-activated protein kinase phosphatase 1, putative n=3 Tax=Plasmodium knowlesi TaxID=5850 RepID=A0A1A7W468_PLAKH|nr:mitogen-activated protein kinase phosphatase 1, putative [Plasmodium knowlesi strain H]OTN64184.1 putative Mitogen-activated protein kinase phosphatase 1 [Plasmodium knowlesi]CAA9990656.1 mitogen-activated protein kinase phosphatase 1, putative [Plasmodium knowlesi strain H]SBO25976.1 mitogen-activated protein kinase phosphatase 1, putative [Plasmodium knowlesi strain H]SBO28702.1 mitogen-activated protein kinase phosphatase 1, putative [Plasmodium knowlesi strain H]VVS80130.1 mitogen-activ